MYLLQTCEFFDIVRSHLTVDVRQAGELVVLNEVLGNIGCAAASNTQCMLWIWLWV